MTTDEPASSPEPDLSDSPTAPGSSFLGAYARDRFDPHELAMVLSHYDLGSIDNIREYPRGSRRAPKMCIRARRGDFLLKRRAPGRDDPYRVAFAHHLQLHLEEHVYPVAGLVGTRDDNNSMLQLQGRIYEMFHFVDGSRYDRSPAQTNDAGRALGRLHQLLGSHQPVYDPPRGGYHGSSEVDGKFAIAVNAVLGVEPTVDSDALAETCTYLRKAYHDAAKRVDDVGYRSWPLRLIHGDWHPGNLIFHNQQVAAVLDFDSARQETTVADIANAALQFAMRMNTPDDPTDWPDDFDVKRIRDLILGYDEGIGEPMDRAQLAALPWLMIEALIIECMVPIAATGSFARIPGSGFLQMVQRKVQWLRPRAKKLVHFIDE